MNRNAWIELCNVQILIQVGPEAGSRSSGRRGRLPYAAVIADNHGAAIAAKSDRVHVHVDRVGSAIYIIARNFRPSGSAVERTNQGAVTRSAAEKHVVGVRRTHSQWHVVEALAVADSAVAGLYSGIAGQLRPSCSTVRCLD